MSLLMELWDITPAQLRMMETIATKGEVTIKTAGDSRCFRGLYSRRFAATDCDVREIFKKTIRCGLTFEAHRKATAILEAREKRKK